MLTPPALQVSAYMLEIIALVLLPLAVLIVAYSLVVFVCRNSQMACWLGWLSAPSRPFLVSIVDMWNAFSQCNGANTWLGQQRGVV